MSGVIYSFYRLLKEYQIEIPIIQRDYAQGREDVKARDVRKNMVRAMYEATATPNGHKLFFDYVYGRIEEDKFIPFDGQQRLTTLFLFHRYVFERMELEEEKVLLHKFSYHTRQSSKEFCWHLVENKVIPVEGKLSEHVIDQPWFYADWQKDPTIMGMLHMLDEIHEQSSQKDFSFIAQRLKDESDCPITFHFVDMGRNKLSDEIYVKMNARGKRLTPFENFKASLEEYLENGTDKGLLERFRSSVDGKWLRLFWNEVNKDTCGNKVLPDKLFLSFFNRHFMNVWWHYTKSVAGSQGKEDHVLNERIQNELLPFPTDDQFISWDIYKNVLDKCGVSECLTPLFNLWDRLQDNTLNEIQLASQAIWNRDSVSWNFFEGYKNKNNDGKETYPSQVASYGLLKYFQAGEYEPENLRKWMRVVWNIVENATIDSLDSYQSALLLIDEIAEGKDSINEWLADANIEIKSGFASEQVEEERAKARQMVADRSTWEKVIMEAEQFAFFKGAIRFLFRNEKGEICWDDFSAKWNYAQMFFYEKGVKEKEELAVQLMQKFVINCNSWGQLYDRQIFTPEAATWKQLLLGKNNVRTIHYCLMQKSEHKEFAKQPEEHVRELLCDEKLLKLLVLEKKNLRLRWNYNYLALYKPYGRYDAITLDWLYDNSSVRNRRTTLLNQAKANITILNQEIPLNRGDCLFWGWDIEFIYKDVKFAWSCVDGKIHWVRNDGVWDDKLCFSEEEFTPDLKKCEELIEQIHAF